MIDYAKIVANVTKLKKNCKSVLEIGSRDGDDAEKLRHLFNIDPSSVYIVEPNPDQVPLIKNKYPRATVFDFAVSDTAGTSTFNKVRQEFSKGFVGTSSLMNRPDFYPNKVDVIEVVTRTGEDLLNLIPEPTIDLCKIDVEGHTFEVLNSFGEALQRINTIHIESEHVEKWKGQKLYSVNSAFLRDNGFTQILFMHVGGGVIQSDSVWARNEIL